MTVIIRQSKERVDLYLTTQGYNESCTIGPTNTRLELVRDQ